MNYFVNVGEPVMIGSDRLALEESERLSRLQKALESYQCHWRWLAEQSKLRPELRPDDVWIFQ